jgi:hypothetical protein
MMKISSSTLFTLHFRRIRASERWAAETTEDAREVEEYLKKHVWKGKNFGGAERDRTADLLVAKYVKYAISMT